MNIPLTFGCGVVDDAAPTARRRLLWSRCAEAYLFFLPSITPDEALLEAIARANHLGLFTEEIEPSTGAFLGNFPQAFTHVGLLSSILYLIDARTTLAGEARS